MPWLSSLWFHERNLWDWDDCDLLFHAIHIVCCGFATSSDFVSNLIEHGRCFGVNLLSWRYRLPSLFFLCYWLLDIYCLWSRETSLKQTLRRCSLSELKVTTCWPSFSCLISTHHICGSSWYAARISVEGMINIFICHYRSLRLNALSLWSLSGSACIRARQLEIPITLMLVATRVFIFFKFLISTRSSLHILHHAPHKCGCALELACPF